MAEFIYVWPCGTWCRQHNAEQFMHEANLGDDYEQVSVPDGTSDETIDALVDALERHQMDPENYPVWMGHEASGLVYISIKGAEYTYSIDAALIPAIRRRFTHAPWKGLKQLIAKCNWYVDPKGVLHECR